MNIKIPVYYEITVDMFVRNTVRNLYLCQYVI